VFNTSDYSFYAYLWVLGIATFLMGDVHRGKEKKTAEGRIDGKRKRRKDTTQALGICGLVTKEEMSIIVKSET